MANSLFYFLTLFAACRAEFSVMDYVSNKKLQIMSYDGLFPRRALDGEQLTTTLANAAAQDVAQGMMSSLTSAVSFMWRERDIAVEMMYGTPAQGCVSGIAGYMDNVVTQGSDYYKDCSADVQSRLSRLNYSLAKKSTNYQEMYQRALAGIDNCAKTYPNVGSKSRLMMCVDSWERQYFTYANRSMFNTSDSPAMNQFLSLVVGCAQAAVTTVADKGWTFVNMTARCYKMSGNSDYESYGSQLALAYSKSLPAINLIDQTIQAQRMFMEKEIQLQEGFRQYYNFRTSALGNYELTSRNETYYADQISERLSAYRSTVSSTSDDNPAQGQCGVTARQELTATITAGSQAAIQCYQNLVNQTRRVLLEVESVALELLGGLTSGNPSIILCFKGGQIYAKEVIMRCSSLDITELSIKIAESYDKIAKNIEILKENVELLSNSSVIPCGRSIMRKVGLGCERSLYNYQRCMYRESGTNYEVTTPSSSTPTTDYHITYYTA